MVLASGLSCVDMWGTMTDRATDLTQDIAYEDRWWWSKDGIRLHARHYVPVDEPARVAPPVLCLPGLTRNARDFDRLAPHIARNRPVFCLDFRGRGESGYSKDAMTYTPLIYAQDVVALIDELQIERFALVGTSLGGIVSMLLAATLPGRVAAVALNDVGPAIEENGLARIRSYVGSSVSYPTWVHAARAVGEAFGDTYPDWTLDDWLVFVKRTHRLTPEGRITLDYDANIAVPFRAPGGEVGVDLWPAFAALKGVPTLILRGALSDLFADATAQRMLAALDKGKLVTIARVGHAPTLDEPEAVKAIDALLKGIKG